MENSILTTVRWQNAEVYRPEQYQESIIYINDENKVGVLDNTVTGCTFDDKWNISYQSDWKELRKHYRIEYWCYQYTIIPESLS